MKISNIIFTVLTLLALSACVNNSNEQDKEISIIPEPLELKVNNGSFTLNQQTQLIADADNAKTKDVADYFVKQVNRATGFSLKVISPDKQKRDKNVIIFSDKDVDMLLGDEGYSLTSNDDRVVLKGTPHGLFYGVQTLFQLLPPEIYASTENSGISWKIPAVEITDKPRFKWRGMHLDVGRHMFPVSFIKKYIDFIAMHKMNTFHWHLTEDQGWRIEIKKYPKLTEIGAWRKGTQIGKSDSIDNKRYGGFYTQDEIKEIVKYAGERFVTVVPEIEMPGHSVAALAAYPQLSCTGGPFKVRTLWGISDDIYCAGNDSVFTFLENVLTEVMELFPSKYIHIGGDEAPKMRWEKCPKCQARIKEEGLKDEHELQSYFITRIEKFLNSRGRQIIGWDEILEGGLAPNAAVMSWRGIEGGIAAAKQKHNVVMTPTDYCYFDFYQAPPENEPLAIGGYLPLEKVYSYEPVPKELTPNEQKYIMGVQANQWTEYIATPELAEYMTLPRLCALAEVAWSPKDKRDWNSFRNRMKEQYDRLDMLNVNYHWPTLKGLSYRHVFIDDATVNIVSDKGNTEIRYTTDGSEPTRNSKLYTKPIKVTETTFFKVKEFAPNGKSSAVYEAHYIKEKPRKPVKADAQRNGVGFEFYEIPKGTKSVSELEELNPGQKGVIEKFDFPLSDDKLPEQFGIVYNAYINVPTTGVYSFSVLSNDGSRLFIDDTKVVDNDGLHGAYEKSGEIALQKGLHKIKLLYFQAGGGKDLKVSWEGPGFEKREITKKWFY